MKKISPTYSSINNQIKELTNISLNKRTESIFGFMAQMIFILFALFCFFGGAILGILITWQMSGFFIELVPFVHINIKNINTIFQILNFLTPIFIITMFILLFSGGIYTMNWIYEKCNLVKKIQVSINLLHKKLQDTLGIQEDISGIIILIHEIQEIIIRLKIMLRFRFLFSDIGKMKLQKIGLLATDIVLSILLDLRSDLTLRLTEQQSTLEEAKSEVSTHIHGTDELNQVSELQRQRLDQQIAQFEELQRTLVRV